MIINSFDLYITLDLPNVLPSRAREFIDIPATARLFSLSTFVSSHRFGSTCSSICQTLTVKFLILFSQDSKSAEDPSPINFPSPRCVVLIQKFFSFHLHHLKCAQQKLTKINLDFSDNRDIPISRSKSPGNELSSSISSISLIRSSNSSIL